MCTTTALTATSVTPLVTRVDLTDLLLVRPSRSCASRVMRGTCLWFSFGREHECAALCTQRSRTMPLFTICHYSVYAGLASLSPESLPSPLYLTVEARELQQCIAVLSFTRGVGLQTQVLTLSRQALYPPSRSGQHQQSTPAGYSIHSAQEPREESFPRLLSYPYPSFIPHRHSPSPHYCPSPPDCAL